MTTIRDLDATRTHTTRHVSTRNLDNRTAIEKRCTRHAFTDGECVRSGCHDCPVAAEVRISRMVQPQPSRIVQPHPAAITRGTRAIMSVVCAVMLLGLAAWGGVTMERQQAAHDLSARV